MFCDTFIWGIENSSIHTYDSLFSHVSFLWHGVIYLQPAQSAAESVQSGISEKNQEGHVRKKVVVSVYGTIFNTSNKGVAKHHIDKKNSFN
jgi:hypothetical protein